jgi:hypothetical protein
MKFLTSLDLNKNQLLSPVIHKLSTAPANPVQGLIYYDTDDNNIYSYNSTTSSWDRVTNLRSSEFSAAVLAIVNGLDVKRSVSLATTVANGNLDLNGSETVDGVSTTDGMRVLVKNQTDAKENGIYTVNTAGAWTRATDADAGDLTPSSFVFVQKGILNADTGWFVTNNDSITIGTTEIVWEQFSTKGVVSVGNGLQKSSDNVISVKLHDTANTNDSGLQTSGDGLKIKLHADSNLQLLSTGLAVSDNVVYKTIGTITGDGTDTSFDISHTYGNSDLTVTVRDSSGNVVFTDVKIDNSKVTIDFGSAPDNAVEYYVVIMGSKDIT